MPKIQEKCQKTTKICYDIYGDLCMNNFTFLTDEQIFGDDQLDIIKKYGNKILLLVKDKENDDFVKSSIEKDFDLFEEGNKKRALSILLAKGSMYGLKYFVNHIDAIEYHITMHYTNIEALSYMLEAYSKAIEIQSRLNYSFIMNSIEELVLVSNENWQKVKIEFGKLIDLNRKKYVHLIALNYE